MKISILAILIIFIILQTAGANRYFAGVFGGYQFSNQRTDIDIDTYVSVADETSFETKGSAIGCRVGIYLYSGIAIGADLKYGETSGKGQGITNEETELERELSEKSFYGTLSFRYGATARLRGWVGIALWGSFKDDADSYYNAGGTYSLKAFKSYKVGAEFYITPRVTFGLEIENYEMKKEEQSNYYLSDELSDGTGASALMFIGFYL